MADSAERAEQIAVARRLSHALARQTAFDEAVGIVSCWQGCGPVQARRNLVGHDGAAEQDAEVDRLAALVDARADGRADPDWD
jgi:hypothetical protein